MSGTKPEGNDSPKNNPSKEADGVLEFGRKISIGFGFFILFVALFPYRNTDGELEFRLFHLWHEPFNVWGDTLAGVAGVLAFLWIIITVQIQSRELAAQKEQLELTREELSETRKATQAMADSHADQVKILEKQGAIFEDELNSRKEEKARDLLFSMLEELVEFLADFPEPHWDYFEKRSETGGSKGSIQLVGHHFLERRSPDETVRLLRITLDSQVSNLIRKAENGWLTKVPDRVEFPHMLQSRIQSILDLKVRLGEADAVRLGTMGFPKILESLERVKIPSLWKDGKVPE